MKKRTIALLLALMLCFGCAIGGTVAWLMDSTSEVKNTFTASDIEITLSETTGSEYKLVPGKTYDKDPTVAVDGTKTDLDCYLFVRFVEEGDASTYLTYESLLNEDNGWKQVENTTDVWYRIVKVSDSTKSWSLLKDNKITVKDTVTKDNMSEADDAELIYEAYAIQYEGFENNVAGAWTAAYAQKST